MLYTDITFLLIDKNSENCRRISSFLLHDLINFNELSGKMYLVIFLKVTKKQGFTLPLKIHFWRNHMGGERIRVG